MKDEEKRMTTLPNLTGFDSGKKQPVELELPNDVCSLFEKNKLTQNCIDLIKCLLNCGELQAKDVRGKANTIMKEQDVINLLLEKSKSHDYIGVGVGGVLISTEVVRNGNNKGKEFVLLYKRYHAPEDGLFSIVGGSVSWGEFVESALKKKFQSITKIQENDVEVRKVIRVNNHMNRDISNPYHYLSPAFYVALNGKPEKYLSWGDSRRKGNKMDVLVISSEEDLEKAFNLVSTKDKPCLAWVLIDLISDYTDYFTYTTQEAIQVHKELQEERNKLQVSLDTTLEEIIKGH